MTTQLNTLKAAVSLLEQLEPRATQTPPARYLYALAIVVCDRGWVYIGQAGQEDDWMMISGARQITRWGTTKGLNELVDGPTGSTKLGAPANIRVPMRAVITVIPVNAAKWEGK